MVKVSLCVATAKLVVLGWIAITALLPAAILAVVKLLPEALFMFNQLWVLVIVKVSGKVLVLVMVKFWLAGNAAFCWAA
jgi:hypothetical protein